MVEQQRPEGEGKAGAHTHPAVTHTDAHFPVSHHHKGGLGSEFEHRADWHTHAHTHGELPHSHDDRQEDEEREHAMDAHVHDHTAPTEAPA
jgi:hypothetical protein